MTESSRGDQQERPDTGSQSPSPSEVATGAESAESVEPENDVATPEFGGAYQGPVEPPEQAEPDDEQQNDVSDPEFGGAYQGPVQPPDADQ